MQPFQHREGRFCPTCGVWICLAGVKTYCDGEGSWRLKQSNSEDSTTRPSGSSPHLNPIPDLSGQKLSHFCWLPTVKPFSPTELAARIRAALRKRAATEPSEPYVLGDLTIDYVERRVTLAGRPLPLIAMEYRLLAELSANAGRLLTYEHLLERVWGEKDNGDVRPMRTIVSKLRRKLGDDADNPTYIFTEPCVGYRMAKAETPSETMQ